MQKAVAELTPGDVCTIRGGVYNEEVTISGLKGTKENPIVFRSYPGEIVTFDGTCTAPITSSWEKYKDDIYVTTLEEDIWQLFVDGEMQINARWPNTFWYDYSVFDYTKQEFADASSTFDPITDALSDWFYDKNTKKLSLWTRIRSSDTPETHDIHDKISVYAFKVTNNSTWLVLSNLNFFATTIFICGNNDSSDVSNIRLQTHFILATHHSPRECQDHQLFLT